MKNDNPNNHNTPTDNTQPQMHDLAQLAMPPGLDSLLASIDQMLANAQHTIDQSLQQSTQLIAQSRQQLQQYEQQSTVNSDETGAQDSSANLAFSSLAEQQQAAQASAKAAQEAMDKTIQNMHAQLLEKNKQYEQAVTQQVANHQIQPRISHYDIALCNAH